MTLMGIITRLAFHMFLIAALASPVTAIAQGSGNSIVFLLADASVSLAQEKMAHERLLQLDPNSRFSVHADRLHLKVGVAPATGVANVQSALAQVGLTTTIVPGPYADAAKSANGPADGFPVLINTGNPELDNQNYQAAKAAWIQAYPSAYQQMIDGSPDQ